jgi:hypothetical protein
MILTTARGQGGATRWWFDAITHLPKTVTHFSSDFHGDCHFALATYAHRQAENGPADGIGGSH